MGGIGSGRRGGSKDRFRPAYAPPLYRPAQQPAPPPPKPVEYQLVDLLSEDGLPEEVSEAVRTLLPFIGRCRRLEAIAAEESEMACVLHDLERVMDRENRYLNALMEITGLREPEAFKIASNALYGHEASGIETQSAETEGLSPKGESPVGEAETPNKPHPNQGRTQP